MGQGQARELPFVIGEHFTSLSGSTIWSVHAGRRKADDEPVTVFVFDFTGKSDKEIQLARSAHLRLKTLRHPNILRYIDGIELPTCIYVVTEEAVPLGEHLEEKEGYSDFSLAWGLHQTIKAISFLSVDCGLVHRNICLSSIFVDSAGEWKVGGVEFMHQFSDSAPPGKTLDGLRKYDPPENTKPASARRTEKWSTDIWGLGCLVWEVYNGPLPQVSALRNTSKLPKSLVPHYCQMVSANPKSRPNPATLLSSLREHGGYLSNQFIGIALRIEELQIMEPSQRNDLFNELNKSLDSFPERFAKRKILPQLINAFEFGGAGSAVLAPLFKLGRLLEDAEYQRKIVPCVVKLFSSTDRATRLHLLQQLEHFIGHLQPSTVNNQIFPQVVTGFTDTVPALREQTIKSMLLLAPKLSDSVLNTQLLKYLAKCQLDEQPGIRTNTTVCLGKIACHLNPATRHKILVSAFLRALKDPFPPARCAGIGAMALTNSYYTTVDIATRLLPALCTMTIDKEKVVRDQAFQTANMFLQKLEKLSQDPEAAAEQQKTEAATSSWTGWAVSSLTSKFYRSTLSTDSGQRPHPPTTAGTGRPAEERKDAPRAEREAQPRWLDEKKETQRRPDTEGWDEDEWEDFTSEEQPQDVGEGGDGDGDDLEGWEDDGWGTLSEAEPQGVSSGADFFDTFHGGGAASERTKAKNQDFFETFVATGTSRGSRERSPPPPVSSALFEGEGYGSGGGATEESGWGDWGSEFVQAPPRQQASTRTHHHSGGLKLGTSRAKGPPLFTMPEGGTAGHGAATTAGDHRQGGGGGDWGGDGGGWDFESDWGSFERPHASSPGATGSHQHSKRTVDEGGSRQELLQKRREERRQKQQAAREKRAAGMALKPGGLGTVKKD